MTRESKKYTPAAFVEKLKSGTDEPKPIVFVGMLKSAEDDQHMMFAQGVSCSHWTAIPIERIDSIELISEIPCKDHSHPLVKMILKMPASEEASMYASLAQTNFSTPALPQSKVTAGLAMLQHVKRIRDEHEGPLFHDSGPEVWFPCWSRCMDDLLEFASEQPADQWRFWSSLAYQICGQICP